MNGASGATIAGLACLAVALAVDDFDIALTVAQKRAPDSLWLGGRALAVPLGEGQLFLRP